MALLVHTGWISTLPWGSWNGVLTDRMGSLFTCPIKRVLTASTGLPVYLYFILKVIDLCFCFRAVTSLTCTQVSVPSTVPGTWIHGTRMKKLTTDASGTNERLRSSSLLMAKFLGYFLLFFFFLFPRSSWKSRTFAQTGQACHEVLLSLCVKWKWLGKQVVRDSSLCLLPVWGSPAADLCTLRLTVQTMVIFTDNPRIPHSFVITAFHTECCWRGHFLDAYAGVKMLVRVCVCVCPGLTWRTWCLITVMALDLSTHGWWSSALGLWELNEVQKTSAPTTMITVFTMTTICWALTLC